jgi:hypothetical protein
MKVIPIIIGLIMATMGPTAWSEENAVHVGRSTAGQLKFQVNFPLPFELLPSIFPGKPGYATGDLGIHANDDEDAANDFYLLSPACDLRFILVAKTPGMEVWNDTGSGYMAISESFYIGQPFFDTHPLWNIVTGTPGNTYSVTLKLHDANGVYSDSAPFELSFTPVDFHPVLNLTRRGAQRVTLTWTTDANGWILESSISIAGPIWNTITNPPSLDGTNFTVNLASTNTQQFFRLRTP